MLPRSLVAAIFDVSLSSFRAASLALMLHDDESRPAIVKRHRKKILLRFRVGDLSLSCCYNPFLPLCLQSFLRDAGMHCCFPRTKDTKPLVYRKPISLRYRTGSCSPSCCHQCAIFSAVIILGCATKNDLLFRNERCKNSQVAFA